MTNQIVSDIMTSPPVAMQSTESAAAASRSMRDENIGDVIVFDGENLCGIVTDRDIVLRVVAGGVDPSEVQLGEMCSSGLVTTSPDSSVDEVVQIMREKAIRRVPVVQDGKPIGIVSLGDLAVRHGKESLLRDISAAPAQT